MLLEWLRRHDAKLDAHLRNYLFIEQPVLEKEHALEAGAAGPARSAGDGSLGIGSLRGKEAR